MQMNMGLHSIVNCPGQYSLQVAEFSGRSVYDFNPTAPPAHNFLNLKDSPLRTAHDDAERMAEKLAKAPEIQKLGVPVYVFHDRSTSKVFIGAFNSPQDPAAASVRDHLDPKRLRPVQQEGTGQGRHRYDDRAGPGIN